MSICWFVQHKLIFLVGCVHLINIFHNDTAVSLKIEAMLKERVHTNFDHLELMIFILKSWVRFVSHVRARKALDHCVPGAGLIFRLLPFSWLRRASQSTRGGGGCTYHTGVGEAVLTTQPMTSPKQATFHSSCTLYLI